MDYQQNLQVIQELQKKCHKHEKMLWFLCAMVSIQSFIIFKMGFTVNELFGFVNQIVEILQRQADILLRILLR